MSEEEETLMLLEPPNESYLEQVERLKYKDELDF